MFEKIKKIFTNKEKRIENLVSFLVILVITLIIINKILGSNKEKEENYKNETGVTLATQTSSESVTSDNLEKRLETILSKISGVGKVSVLITYSESSSLVPIYNVSSSVSTVEETDTSGGTRKTETENNEKGVVTDSSSNVITEKMTMPVIEGVVITAQGASDSNIKSNIISAAEAATGIATHKIQVFEMGDE